MTELTNALSPGQYEDFSTDLPTRDDLRFGEVDLVLFFLETRKLRKEESDVLKGSALCPPLTRPGTSHVVGDLPIDSETLAFHWGHPLPPPELPTVLCC